MARTTSIHGATLTRRQFVKTGGTLVVGFALVGERLLARAVETATGKNSLDAALSNSWFEIHADNTILMRTGKVDFGQSTAHTAYKQLVAEELNVAYEAITSVVMGDTDRTPDGGFSAGFLEYGGQNIRKAAAYTYQALLDLAATRLRVDKSQLKVENGVVSAGGNRVTYGELVRGQQLKLTIPVQGDLTSMFGLTVTGNPPLKPTSQYTIIGKSFANTVTPSKVTAKEQWVTDVRLPNMAPGPALWRPTSMGVCRCSSAEEMAGCAPTTRRRVTKSGDLTATRKMPAGFRAPASFRAVLSLLHRSSQTAASSLLWGRILRMATDLR